MPHIFGRYTTAIITRIASTAATTIAAGLILRMSSIELASADCRFGGNCVIVHCLVFVIVLVRNMSIAPHKSRNRFDMIRLWKHIDGLDILDVV